ncbi:MAG: C1 family peptidase [Thermonemataceae bacterium]|nr:C1 family peptidase [Thermonemataceae bacterium]
MLTLPNNQFVMMRKYFLWGLCTLLTNFVSAQPTQDFEMEVLIQCPAVEDQQYSPTCWSFGSNSFLESELLRMKKPKVNLSEMYFAYHAYILKTKQFLATQGSSFFTGGGQFHDILHLLKIYGAMPESAYQGKAIFTGHYHSPLDTLMKHYAENLLHNNKKELNSHDEDFLKSILNTFLSVPPKNFIYENQNYTPQSFSRDVLGINPDDYIEITSLKSEKYYEKIILKDKYNWTKDYYYNVPLQDFSEICLYALQKGYSVLWDGDSVEPTFQAENGLAFLPDSVQVNEQNRQIYIDNKSTQIEHIMHIVGVAKEKEKESGKKRKMKTKNAKHWFYVKNSWGEISSFKGFIYMSEDYFKMKTIAIALHKDALPTDIRKKLKIK